MLGQPANNMIPQGVKGDRRYTTGFACDGKVEAEVEFLQEKPMLVGHNVYGGVDWYFTMWDGHVQKLVHVHFLRSKASVLGRPSGSRQSI
jgi:hypothetical protein